MKLNILEAQLVFKLCGMEREEQESWREFNPLYQFAMRSNLRNYPDTTPAAIYVFDKIQAEYLSARFGGCPIVHVPGVVTDPKKKNGRPTAESQGKTKLPDAEKQKRYRERQKAIKELNKAATPTNLAKEFLNKINKKKEK